MADSHAAIAESLAAIRRAALGGDLAAMPALSQGLDLLLLSPGFSLSPDAAQSLHRLAEENAVLLRAAQRGLRAARRRLAEIRGVATGLTTYSAQGQRQTAALRPGRDHRA